MKRILKATTATITMFMLLDVMGFMAWILSGQIPTDNYYVGTITAHIVKAIFF